jgi:DNA-binding transcriptional MerR regulator
VSPKSAAATSKRRERRSAARRGSEDPVIPDKLYFRIGEVSRICRLPAYVLRFWETQFSQLRPTKSSTGQRMYRRADVECALRIRSLLYEEGFTIPGARQQLLTERKKRSQNELPFNRNAPPEGVRRVRQGLRELLGMLSAPRR